MNDTYVEVMVARKKPPMLGFLKILLYGLAIICFFMSMYMNALLLAGAAIFAALAFFVLPRLDVEYEYLYLDKEITIDKIMSREKRKNVYTLDLNKMEFMARASSHELDSYRARNLKTYDFTSGMDTSPVYTIVYAKGGEPELVNIEPNEEMLRAIRTVFPRKVIDV
ncbi:MAG: DUF6106 family protein [Lachnospiraceae bacterium]|nr:DUF6106 family protein [Lachnospiraceae bacterium]